MLDRLLNNPVLFTVIMVVIVVVAVSLILYFLVFKDKIKLYFENKKIEKEKKLAQMESDKALASEIFSQKDQPTKTKLTKQDQEEINRVIDAASGKNSSLVTKSGKQKSGKEKLTAEEQAKIDSKLSSVQGGVSGVGKTQPKKDNKKETTDDNNDDDTKSGLDFMNQFK